ncbi:hypothetical protein BRADI_1g53461v3 [Brachypodium distachyon]|uniref:Uncharacterized protein n=1 Tax=Brachypodium distachyon TaxID=15368 RepID=A0A2K2DR79_BRADI|nr:hypothetical protein BRADI_1g53461v3 [Brachypodium distachyon]
MAHKLFFQFISSPFLPSLRHLQHHPPRVLVVLSAPGRSNSPQMLPDIPVGASSNVRCTTQMLPRPGVQTRRPRRRFLMWSRWVPRCYCLVVHNALAAAVSSKMQHCSGGGGFELDSSTVVDAGVTRVQRLAERSAGIEEEGSCSTLTRCLLLLLPRRRWRRRADGAIGPLSRAGGGAGHGVGFGLKGRVGGGFP